MVQSLAFRHIETSVQRANSRFRTRGEEMKRFPRDNGKTLKNNNRQLQYHDRQTIQIGQLDSATEDRKTIQTPNQPTMHPARANQSQRTAATNQLRTSFECRSFDVRSVTLRAVREFEALERARGSAGVNGRADTIYSVFTANFCPIVGQRSKTTLPVTWNASSICCPVYPNN